MSSRQTFLDMRVVGDEVAVDFRTQGKGCKVFKILEIVSTPKHPRLFVLTSGLRFSADGQYAGKSDDEFLTWPGPCCLEDPDSGELFWKTDLTRRQESERWHARETLDRLVRANLSAEQVIAMIKVVCPDYKPDWNP